MSGEDWLSDYLLGEETESDAAEARRRLDADPAVRARVERLAEVTGMLNDLSPAAWQVASDPQSGSPATSASGELAAAPVRRRWRLVSPALTAALAVVAIAIGVGVGALIWSGGGGGGSVARTVALRPLPGTFRNAAGSARLTTTGELTLSVDRLPAAGAGRYYEAWLMTDARHLVPLASFEVRGSGSARVTVPLPAPAARYRYFDVSLQTVSGGTAHSNRSVLRGPTNG
jgi:Anti-sigma-K factor rskA